MTIQDYAKSEEYKIYLEINNQIHTDETLAGFLMWGDSALAKELYDKLGRKCRNMTAFSYPNKLTLEEFRDEVTRSIEPFYNNLKKLKAGPLWPEDWIETFGAWMEMEKGDWA